MVRIIDRHLLFIIMHLPRIIIMLLYRPVLESAPEVGITGSVSKKKPLLKKQGFFILN
jgi:hypothetical protein